MACKRAAVSPVYAWQFFFDKIKKITLNQQAYPSKYNFQSLLFITPAVRCCSTTRDIASGIGNVNSNISLFIGYGESVYFFSYV
jgi:hypothetical protein